MSERRKRTFRMPSDADDLSEDVASEVRFHLEKKVERLMKEGMGEAEAWALARSRFGDVERVTRRMRREGAVERKRTAIWDRFRQDAHYAVRQALRSRGFTGVTTLTLALGIGATTAIFSVVDGILFRPLPFPDSEELTAVWADWSRRGGPVDEWLNFPTYFDLKERSHTLSAVGAWDSGTLTLTGVGEPEQVSAGFVSHDMLPEVLRVQPATGRSFAPDDDRPGAPATVLLTDAFWRRALGGRPDVLGARLSLNDEVHTVIGILPADFQPPFAVGADVWIPLRQDRTDSYCGRGGACMLVVARRAAGTTIEEARAEADRIATQLAQEFPRTNANTGFTLVPLQESLVADARSGLLVLLGAVALVLLIACVNVANLLLARGTTRTSELALRSALGAGRRRITAQLLTESAFLAGLGGGLGLLLAYAGTAVLVAIAPAGTPRIGGVEVNVRVLAFALAVSALAGLFFGVVPALRAARGDLESALRAGGRGASRGGGGIRGRGALVSGQVAVALVLLVGAGLLLRTFRNLRSEDLGFTAEGVLTVQLGLPGPRYPDGDARRAFVAAADERIAALPGVRRVGATSWLPLTGVGTDTRFTIEGRPPLEEGQRQAVWFRRITEGYPEAMGMRLVAGRWIAAADDARAPPVVVINEGLATRYFPDESPLGQRINLGDPASPTWREIVGVAAEARYFGIRDGSRDALYLPYEQSPTSYVTFAILAARDAASLGGEVRGVITSLDPSLAVGRIETMRGVVDASLGSERLVTLLTTLFAGAAFLLAVVGLYGVVSYGVNRRLGEMGVRLALGAGGGQIEGLVLRQSLTLVGIGLLVGVLGGLRVTRLMESLLFGVSAADPWTYAAAALGLAAVATVAAAIPARRAARVDPIRVLRAE